MSDRVLRERLHDGALLADIIEDREPPLFFMIVQRQDSAEILFLGQYHSRSDAADAAREFMTDHLNRQEAA